MIVRGQMEYRAGVNGRGVRTANEFNVENVLDDVGLDQRRIFQVAHGTENEALIDTVEDAEGWPCIISEDNSESEVLSSDLGSEVDNELWPSVKTDQNISLDSSLPEIPEKTNLRKQKPSERERDSDVDQKKLSQSF